MLKAFYTITAFQVLFFSLVVITSRNKKPFHYWLSSLFFTLFIVLVFIVYRWHYGLIHDSLAFRFFTIVFEYSLSPLFYIFIVKATQQKLEMKAWQLALAIPFLIGLVFLVLPQGLWDKYWLQYHSILTVNFYSQAIIFFMLALNRYKIYQNEIKDHLTQDYLQDVKIIRLALYGFVIMLFLGLVGNIIRIQLKFESSIINQSIEMMMLFLINALLFLGLKLPNEIKELSFDEHAYSGDLQSNKKYIKSNLTSDNKKDILEKLNHIVHHNMYYRTPNLTIKGLSEKLDTQSKHLSQVINENYEQNFCDYINTLRIEDAKAQLEDEENQQKTILEICYEIGFNSKSTFNDVFKKQTGLTPTAYRKSHEANQ